MHANCCTCPDLAQGLSARRKKQASWKCCVCRAADLIEVERGADERSKREGWHQGIAG
jgi:hypothetical protein